MNTPGSVAYGWGVLILAGGVSYYYAKKEIDSRRRNQERSGSRPNEILTWQDRIKQDEARPNAEKQMAPPSAVNAAIAATPAGEPYKKS